MTDLRTSPLHDLIGRWGARDFVSLLAVRANDVDDPSQIGFYDARTRSVRAVSQRAFFCRAAGYASQLLDEGVRPGDRIVVLCPQPEAALTAYLAAVMITAVPVIHAARPGFDDSTQVTLALRDAVERLGTRTRVVAQTRHGRPIMKTDAPHIPLELETLEYDARGFDHGFVADPERILHLQPTSGSTGAQKYTALTHENLLVNCSSLATRTAFEESDHTVSWLPLFHDLGLVGMALKSLVCGVDLTLLSPFDFLKDPSCWIRTMSDVGGSYTASPNFGFDQVLRRVDDSRLAGVDLARCRRLYCGGEPVDARTVALFLERFAPYGLAGNALRPTYGMAEATLVVSMPFIDDPIRYATVPIGQISRLSKIDVVDHGPIATLPADPDPATVTVVSTGPATPTVEITLVDEAGMPITEADWCGEIVVAGPSVSAGYLRADGTMEPHGADGFHTGDIGFFHEGDLYIVERTKNTIIRNGHNYSAAVLERELARAVDRPLNEVLVLDSDVRPGVGRVTAVIGVDRGEDLNAIRDLVSFASRDLEPLVEQLLLVPRGALPRTTSGKKQHHRVRAMIQLDEFERMTRFDLVSAHEHPVIDEILDLDAIDARHLVLRLVTEHAHLRGITRDVAETTDLVAELGFDSLAMYELAVTIEGQLAIGVPDESLASVRRVSDLLDLVDACRRGEVGPTVNVSDRIAAIAESLPQTYLDVRAQKNRQLLVEDRWITDFASLNYLGLDLDARVVKSVQPMLEEWGVHPSWTRAVASPAPYRELERALAHLVDAPSVVVFPTITLLHFGVLPKLAGATGTILIDQGSHSSILEAAELARSRGATLVPVRRSDPEDLEAKLRQARPDGPRIVTTNGVYSMSGNIPDLRAYAELAARYDATLYVDDAHGLGLLGANPSDQLPYGHGGGGVVRHLGLTYDNIVYVGGLSKAFSSMAAFVTCRDDADRSRIETASTMLFSGPIPVASLASALAGLRINELEGDQLRARIWRLTTRLIAGARDLGFVIDNDTDFPCVTPIVGDIDRTVLACRVLWQHGVLITPAVFPAMPLERGGLRISVTASNTDSEIEQLLTALAAVQAGIEIAPELATATARAGLFEY